MNATGLRIASRKLDRNFAGRAIGDRLRVYVDGVLQMEHAGAEVVPGKVGVATYRAAASFGEYVAYEP